MGKRLYTNNEGAWVGTQCDAKQFGAFDYIEVPTSKSGLLKFLNEYQVGATDDKSDKKHHPLSCSANPNIWDVQDAVLNCDRNHLGAALASIITRLHEELREA